MPNLEDSLERLTRATDKVLSEPARNWLQDSRRVLSTSENLENDLGLYSAMAKRKLGATLLEHAPVIETEFSSFSIQHWTSADSGRLILLMTAIQHHPQQTQHMISAYYKMADDSEKIALIRGLIFFAPATYLTELALDIGRTNNLELLAALTLDNPYPAAFYSEQAFNQMVLKGLFLGLPIDRVAGLQKRANTDLARMSENYVVEREHASRSVPEDIWLAIGAFASERGLQQMIKYLADEEIGHRYYAALALAQYLFSNPDQSESLRDRLSSDQDEQIMKLVQDHLQAIE